MYKKTNKNKQPPEILQSPLKAFWYAIEGKRFLLSIMLVGITVGNVAIYLMPYFLKVIADRVVALGPVTPTFNDFASPLSWIITLLIISEVCYRGGHIIQENAVIHSFDRITSALYRMLLSRPTAYFEETFAGELNRRIEQIGLSTKFFIEYFPWEVSWPIMASITTVVLLATVHLLLVVVFLIWLSIFLVISYFLLGRQYKISQTVSERHATLSGNIVDVLGNTPIVHVFGREKHEYEYYRGFMNSAMASERRERTLSVINKFHQGTSIALLAVLLTVTSIYLFTRREMTVGDFVLVASIIPTLQMVVWSFGEIIVRGLRNYGEYKNAIESLRSEITPPIDGKQEIVLRDLGISFEHVTFSYGDTLNKVLDDFTLDILPGTRVGLVGRSGAGKSTIVKLLLRSYDPDKGRVMIDGQDIKKVSIDSLRKAISFVPQDTALFHRSLYENILYARPDANKEEVIAASEKAHAHDFIIQTPKGYDTLVGERGIKLSGGQRQRIALARAMLKNSPILILDEATSALDSESEEIVQKGLQELFKDRVVLAVAHRLSTLRSMDRIVVIEDGKIIEDGAPQELLAKEQGIFKAMWEHQKSGFV